MFDEKEGPIDSLVHLWVDGAFNRRELVRRVAKYTGSVGAAIATLQGYEAYGQSATACPADVKVPADAPDLITQDVTYPSEDSSVMGYLAYPKSGPPKMPAVIVIHENRGLVEHIRDVARRVARAGFVAIAPDLLSRQGGVAQFPDATQQSQAYNRTTPVERQADLIATLGYIKTVPSVIHDRIGTVGFCAGGGNAWNLALVAPELRAVVPFYGTPVPALDRIANLQTPALAIYAERDRNLTISMAPVMSAIIQQQKTFGFVVYEGAGHAFHNDTGAAYNAPAACDAWARTIAWFDKHLRA
ncbi:MAG: dienelactone hydrolase family protein [Acidobacteriota bacterium]